MISVLYVDDEEGLLDVGKFFLEESRLFTVDIVPSAPVALTQLNSKNYDAIISDYQMPDMDGIEFLRKVRKKFGDIPFILFTGRGREEVVIEAINNGADFYLQKGGDPQAQFAELSHKISQAVRRKQTERSLRDSEKRLADIIDFLPDGTFAIDRSGHVIAWNRAIEEMTGVHSRDIMGKGKYEYALPFYGFRRQLLIDLIDEPDEKIAEFYSNISRSGNSITTQTHLAHPKGHRISLLIKVCPLYNQKGEITGAIESIRDITDLKHAEDELIKKNEELNASYQQISATEAVLRLNLDDLSQQELALRTSEERYRNVVEDQTEFISRFLPDGTHVFVNQAYCRYFGLNHNEILGKRFQPDIPAEDQGRVDRLFKSLTPGHPVGTIEHRIIFRDGQVRWQRWSIRAIFNPSGTITEYQSVGMDITRSKHAEVALRQANNKLKLLYSITRHDITNQLSSLKGNLAVIQKKQPDISFSKYFQNIMTAAEQVTAMIQFTKTYEEIGVKAPAWQDCRTLVDTAAKQVSFGKLMVKNDIPPDYFVLADPLIVKVFYNLMDNALRYGGKITTIRFSVELSGDAHLIVCEDNGDGVTSDEKKRIFERGFGRNTGLGLFLVREILSITGITIAETGEPGKGARFEMVVPGGAYRTAKGAENPVNS